ncbi:MAG: ribosome maturation factor RimP [Myxococcota bacterium]
MSGTSQAAATRKRIIELVEPVLSSDQYELVEVDVVVERGQFVVRLFIDTVPPGTPEKGVSVDDCRRVSKVVGDLLDVEDVVSGKYNLEVSSPGLFRPLTKSAHFERSIGQRVKVKTYEKRDGRRVYTGVLEEMKHTCITVQVDDGQRFDINLSEIAKANLEPELEF